MGADVSPSDATFSEPTQCGTSTVSPAETKPSSVSSAYWTATGQMSFRTFRAQRACEVCRARKVRCDVSDFGTPCTNCAAFHTECRIPISKRRKQNFHPRKNAEDFDRANDQNLRDVARTDAVSPGLAAPKRAVVEESASSPATRESRSREDENDSPPSDISSMNTKFTRAPITEAGRVAFLGESSSLDLLGGGDTISPHAVHYPVPDDGRDSRPRIAEMDPAEVAILHQRGALLLPPRPLCDDLIDAYFKWVHPILPVINRTSFMRQYRNVKNPPSLLLLQAMLLAGSRVYTNAQLLDANGSTVDVASTLYRRAKALYDANYEHDRITIVQSLLLLGWYWEGPNDVMKNGFYWSRVAIVVAQSSGMHRSVEKSQLSKQDKRLWKRIWWTLFTRDRAVAVALGRPVHIDLSDTDVEMLAEDDFIEYEGEDAAEYPPDPVHVQFFLQYLKLCEIMGLVLSQQYSVASKGRSNTVIDLAHSDMALADWLQNCPKIVLWETQRHHFWSALLHSNYYTTMCLLHRAYLPPNGAEEFRDGLLSRSETVAFQAAKMIESIVDHLVSNKELCYCPAFIVYSLFTALIMLVYQLRSPVPSIQQSIHKSIQSCMGAMKEVSRVWLVGGMVHELFESIIQSKTPDGQRQDEDTKCPHDDTNWLGDASKGKEDDLGRPITDSPSRQISRDRSRSHSLATVKNQGIGPIQRLGATSPDDRSGRTESFMGYSPSQLHVCSDDMMSDCSSVPARPSGLCLATRSSPDPPQLHPERFHPDLLFPSRWSFPLALDLSPGEESNGGGLTRTPSTTHGTDDAEEELPREDSDCDTSLLGIQRSRQRPSWLQNHLIAAALGVESMDNWGTGPIHDGHALATPSVEDWFQFFCINDSLANFGPNGISAPQQNGASSPEREQGGRW